MGSYNLADAQPVTAQGTGAYKLSDAAPANTEYSLSGFGTNLVNSGKDFASKIVTAVAHPYDTLHNAADVVAGGLNAISGDQAGDTAPDAIEADKKFHAFVGALKDRYGSLDALKNTIYKDPVGFAADAMTLAGGAAGAASKVEDLVAPSIESGLRDSAVVDYSKALAPTTKVNKALTAKVVPELIDRGTTAMSLKGLQAQAQAHLSAVGSAIGDAWANLPAGTTTDLEPIYDHLQSAIENTHSIHDAAGKLIAKGPEAERAIGNISKLQQTLVDASQTDPATGKLVIPSDTVRSLRQYWDDIAARAGRYGGTDLADQASAEAHGMAADAIRSELAKDNPDIAALNREYSLWANVNKVATDTIARKTGQSTPLGVQVARAAGFAKGGPLGAEAMQYLTQAVRSTAWRTVSSVLKDRLADAVAAGNGAAADFYVQKITQAAGAAGATDLAKSSAPTSSRIIQ